MKPSATRIAIRHLESGVFEAPPGLLTEYLRWAIPVFSGHVMVRTQRVIEKMRDREKPWLKAIEDVEKALRTHEQDIKNLQEGQKHVWNVWWFRGDIPIPYKVGVKRETSEVWHGAPKENPEYLFNVSEKRITFRGRKVQRTRREFWGIAERVERQLQHILRHLKGRLEAARSHSGEGDDVNLVEANLLLKEAQKYAHGAKQYKTQAKTTLDIKVPTLKDWRYWPDILAANGGDEGKVAQRLAETNWQAITTALVFKGHKSRGGVWIAGKRLLEVDVPHWGQPSDVDEFQNSIRGIGHIARHEFQHVGQTILQVLTRAKERRGLPSKGIRDTRIDEHGYPIHPSTGQPVYQERRRGPHALQDVEFYTRLADEIGRFETVARRIPLDRRREAVAIYTAAKPGKMEFTFDTRPRVVRVRPQEFFEMLKRNQRGKWKKAVGEFVKGLSDRGVKIPASAARVAEMHLEAGAKEWLQWIVQPAKVLWKHHKDFVQGPVDDAMDAILKDLAPHLVKAIVEQEVDEDVDDFTDGAIAGRWDAVQNNLADPKTGRKTDEWVRGYTWGYNNPNRVKRNDLPPDVKRKVIEQAVRQQKREITEQVVINALEKVWNGINPANTWKAIWAAVQKHGWKLGIVFALVEITETFIIPAALIAITGDPEWVMAGQLPLSEILYAVVFRYLGRVPGDVDDADPDGHLDWYENKFGPVRLACLTS